MVSEETFAFVCKGQHVVLTFDDGPRFPQTDRVLAALQKAAGVDPRTEKPNPPIPATFFTTLHAYKTVNSVRAERIREGKPASQIPPRPDEYYNRFAATPEWSIGHHTVNHPDLSTLEKEEIWKKEIQPLLDVPSYKRAEKAQKARAFRAPYGKTQPRAITKAMADQGMDLGKHFDDVEQVLFNRGDGYNHHMHWDIDSEDWAVQTGHHFKGNQVFKQEDDESLSKLRLRRQLGLAKKVKQKFVDLCRERNASGENKTKPIVALFHDIHEVTADALPDILHFLQEQGVVFKNVQDVEEYSSKWIRTDRSSPTAPEFDSVSSTREGSHQGRSSEQTLGHSRGGN